MPIVLSVPSAASKSILAHGQMNNTRCPVPQKMKVTGKSPFRLDRNLFLFLNTRISLDKLNHLSNNLHYVQNSSFSSYPPHLALA